MSNAFEQARFVPGAPPSMPDALFPDARWRFGSAQLLRWGSPAAEWTLARLSTPGAPTRIFVLPAGASLAPAASLWISNLRQSAVDQDFCSLDDLWVEVLRSGWASYDFNAIQERSFSVEGGALEGLRSLDWPAYAASTALSETLLCALPWDGLPSMWGPDAFSRRMAERESLILERAVGSASGSASKGRRARGPLKA